MRENKFTLNIYSILKIIIKIINTLNNNNNNNNNKYLDILHNLKIH